MEVVPQLIVNGILIAALYALVAAGVAFVYATTRIFHLAHGVVVVASGYAFWWMFVALKWPGWTAAVFALAVAVGAGALMHLLVYEPLRRRGAKGISYLIVTLAMLILGQNVIRVIFGSAPKTFPIQPDVWTIGSVTITTLEGWSLVIVAGLLTFFIWFVRATRLGKAMRATADNEMVAEILGIDTAKTRLTCFFLSSLLSAPAGILLGLQFNLDPDMGVLLVVKGFAASVIGGVGLLGGALLGSLGIGFIEQAAVWFWGSGWRNAATFLVLFLFLLIRPEGLLGRRRAP
jgi:branched-chain amino acid transport system permease protein